MLRVHSVFCRGEANLLEVTVLPLHHLLRLDHLLEMALLQDLSLESRSLLEFPQQVRLCRGLEMKVHNFSLTRRVLPDGDLFTFMILNNRRGNLLDLAMSWVRLNA